MHRAKTLKQRAVLGVSLALWGICSLDNLFGGDALLELNKSSFFYGREYFMLRSGRAEMVLQADRADLGPAFTYLLFDAHNAAQSSRKEGALNFDPSAGWVHSALDVELGGFPYTALGHRTETHWRIVDGIPAVEAVWWAGGVRVTEQIAALGDGVFLRHIVVNGANMAGEQDVTLRLTMPPGKCSGNDDSLTWENGKGCLGLMAFGPMPRRINTAKGTLEIGPIPVQPNQEVGVDTVLLVDVTPAGQPAMAERAKSLRGTGLDRFEAGCRKRWAAASTVNTQDRTVQETFDKARFGLPGMVADDGTMNAGLFEYGAQWVRDSSITAIGALHAGHFELARGVLDRILTKMISKEGVTMIGGGFDSPDLEQFDQMRELLHLLRNYRDWTGDDSLVRQHRDLLLAMIERPLMPRFRDETGMVHNRREFWERQFQDAYELAYQTFVVLGLREAAELAPSLGAEDRAPRWRKEADSILKAMLSHPTKSLVHEGRLIKRRNVTGEVADDPAGFPGAYPDSPLTTEKHHRLMPDSSAALPIFLGVVDPRSELARRTVDDLERLWNARWSDGGYDRYNTSSQPDQPGPWFTTTLVLRAQHAAGMLDRSRRTLDWLNTCPGGRAGAWFEEIPSSRLQMRTCGVVPWASGDLATFVVRHYLGVSFEHGRLVIRPALYEDSSPVSADLRYRKRRLRLDIEGCGPIEQASVDGRPLAVDKDGALRLPRDFAGGKIAIQCRH
jgi:hypothetical protein